MEVIIIKCPYCDEPVAYRILSNSSAEKIERANNDKLKCFDLIKKATKDAYEKNKYNKIKHISKKLMNSIPGTYGAQRYMRMYFLAMEEKLKSVKNPADLHKLRKEIIKSKIIVKRPLNKEFEKQKKSCIADIDKKIKKCKK
ncbi:hypothetical protein J4434_04080 [Candidatus Woesearchaeota archaeon]|nr:hypothetical protein [Candidatus Woesearchaeota archaeon]